MKKYIALITIAAFICLLGVLLFDVAIRVKFLENFSKAQQYKTKDVFLERYGAPVYESTSLSEMRLRGPIQDEEFLSGKTLCLFGYKLPYRFIIVYFDTSTEKKIYITWEQM
jgi:hypothetical protein